LPHAKKKAKTKAKAAKPVSSGIRKTPVASTIGRSASNAKAKKTAVVKKPPSKKVSVKKTPARKTNAKKPVNKKATGKKSENKPTSSKSGAKLKSVAVSKKTEPVKTAGMKPVTGTAAKVMPGRKSVAGKKPAQSSVKKQQPAPPANAGKAINRAGERQPANSGPIETKAKAEAPAPGNGEKKPVGLSTAPDKPPAKTKPRRQASGSSGSVGPGLSKQVPKKRGWRDIEALTERARLKSLLSDIWHEDIDIDLDIFGETDHLFGYYTDKEEVIEIEPEAEEVWEEFEEDES